jgi:hypothetical protein
VTNVAKVESTLNITDEVIRFLITRPDLKAIAKAEVLEGLRKPNRQPSAMNVAMKTIRRLLIKILLNMKILSEAYA